MNPKVIILILNYNRAKDTIDCVKSINVITYNNYEVIVIDNSSTDNSFNLISLTFPGIKIFNTNVNLGYTGGINFGILQAKKENPDYILLLNNDTLVEPGFLSKMICEMEKYPNAFASCGLILAEHDKKTIWYGGGKLIPLRGLAVHLYKDKDKSILPTKNASFVDFITGCMMLLRVTDLEKVGMQDDRFFMYLDDIELSARVKKMGYKLLYIPEAIIYHKVLGEKDSPFKLYYSVRNRLLLIDQMNSGITRIISKIYFISVITLKLFIWSFRNKKFFNAAIIGLSDYRHEIFRQGSGMQFLENY